MRTKWHKIRTLLCKRETIDLRWNCDDLISRKIRMLVKGKVGVLNQKHTREYRVGGLVKNVTILGVCTFWMIPRGRSVLQKGLFVFPSSTICIILSLRFLNKFFFTYFRANVVLYKRAFYHEKEFCREKESSAVRKRVLP